MEHHLNASRAFMTRVGVAKCAIKRASIAEHCRRRSPGDNFSIRVGIEVVECDGWRTNEVLKDAQVSVSFAPDAFGFSRDLPGIATRVSSCISHLLPVTTRAALLTLRRRTA